MSKGILTVSPSRIASGRFTERREVRTDAMSEEDRHSTMATDFENGGECTHDTPLASALRRNVSLRGLLGAVTAGVSR
jgi:hypothetical protein